MLPELRWWNSKEAGPVQTAVGRWQHPGAAWHLLPFQEPCKPAALCQARVPTSVGHNWLVPGRLSSRHQSTFWSGQNLNFMQFHILLYNSFVQCSVTCGNGIQRLQAVCKKHGKDGGHWTVDPENCSQMARPNRIRPCSLRLCESKKPSVWLYFINSYC